MPNNSTLVVVCENLSCSVDEINRITEIVNPDFFIEHWRDTSDASTDCCKACGILGIPYVANNTVFA